MCYEWNTKNLKVSMFPSWICCCHVGVTLLTIDDMGPWVHVTSCTHTKVTAAVQLQNACPDCSEIGGWAGKFLSACPGFMIVTVPCVASFSSRKHEGWKWKVLLTEEKRQEMQIPVRQQGPWCFLMSSMGWFNIL